VLIACVLSGCSPSGERASDDPASSASTADAIESPDEAQSTAQQEVPPATGALLEVQGMQVNLPADWEADSTLVMQAGGHDPVNIPTFLTLFRFPQGLVASIDELTRDNATRTSWDYRLKRRADVTVDGHVASHLEGKVLPREYVVLFSTLANGESLELQFNFANGEPKAHRDEIVQSVLATWEFTS
jgi:hypothetical protein